jgi:hypothetical protein
VAVTLREAVPFHEAQGLIKGGFKMTETKTATQEMVADIRHAMEMYPENEVKLIVRSVESAHELLEAAIKAFKAMEYSNEHSEQILFGQCGCAKCDLYAAIRKAEGR